MRVSASSERLAVEPGATATLTVDVRNTGDVIDGVSARIVGLPEQYVTAEPALLPLFPDAEGQIALRVAVPPTLVAGRHPLTVEVVSHGAKLPSVYRDLDLEVAARPGFEFATSPRTIRARGQARFVLVATNAGNIAVDLELTAVDVDRTATIELSPPTLRLDPGANQPVLLTVKGPRMITGTEIDRAVTVIARATPMPLPAPAGGAADMEPAGKPIERESTVRLRQRPLVGRGLLTALILAGIVALWAGVFLLGLTKVFSGDPMTKQAPASFFLPDGAADGATGAAAKGETAQTPADALPKTGQMPAGSGGSISGTVTATTDGSPVGRILVTAKRMTRDGLQEISSAATQSDGTYTIAGLFPTAYYLEFSSPGYNTVWYGAATAPKTAAKAAAAITETAPAAGARQVTASTDSATKGVDLQIAGRPATVSGTVDPGDTKTKVVTTVTARALLTGGATGKTYTTSTKPNGTYEFTSLPAPGSYEFTFTTTGYQPSTLLDSVAGGDSRLEPTVSLGASVGQIAGQVTDGANPIGGATVTTTLNGKPLAVTTPTTGQVGAYVLGNLPTPGTYVITFSAPGHGSATKIVDLEAGQSITGQDVPLTSGSGTVSGTLLGSNGKGLGGAVVTVGGASTSSGAAAPATTTLTSGAVGSFEISGLVAPGSYTLTFTRDGYAPATVPVTLTDNGSPPTVQVTLAAQLGSLEGKIKNATAAGATVTASDGKNVWTVGSSTPTAGDSVSTYKIDGLQPGTYSVTVTAPNQGQQTGIVTITAGEPKTLNLALRAVN